MSLSVYDCSVPPFDDVTDVALPLMTVRETSKVPPLALRPLPWLFDTTLLSTITNTSGPLDGVKDTMPPWALPDELLLVTDNFTPAFGPVPSARMPVILLEVVVWSMTAKAEPDPVGLMKIPPPVVGEIPFSLM